MLEPCTIPIILHDKASGELRQHGTGTLLRIADVHLIITAHHVVDDEWRLQNMLFIGDHVSNGPAIPLSGASLVQWDIDDGNVRALRAQTLDVAAIELQTSIVSQLSHRTFVNLSQLDVSMKVAPGRFLLFGYPSHGSTPDSANRHLRCGPSLAYSTELYRGPTSSFGNYDPRLHVLFPLPIKGAIALQPAGPRPEKIQGVSGCSIWRTVPLGQDCRTWDVADAKIVAVQSSEYGSKKVVKAVKCLAVVALLWARYRELRRIIEISHPNLMNHLRQFDIETRRLQ